MMSIESIRALSRNAARDAAARNQVPFYLEESDVQDLRARVNGKNLPYNGPLFSFPMIGDHRPKGWRLVKKLFVDTSGLGADNEPALSIRQLADALEPGFGYALIETGQFQAYIGVFKRIQSR